MKLNYINNGNISNLDLIHYSENSFTSSFNTPAIVVSNNYYSGNTVACTNKTFDLSKSWKISFDYMYLSNKAGDWNNIFSFQLHYSISGTDSPYGAIAFTAQRGGVSNPLFSWGSTDISNQWHSYLIEFNGSNTLVYIDNELKSTLSYSWSNSVTGLYLSGGGSQTKINCNLKYFKFFGYISGSSSQSLLMDYPFQEDTSNQSNSGIDFNYLGGSIVKTYANNINVFSSNMIKIT